MANVRPATRLTSKDRARQDMEVQRLREIYQRSLEVLNKPFPDTFLGRKTQEPFPKEKKASPKENSSKVNE